MEEWSGARWWKFDVHTHTPASSDYGKGPNQEEFSKISPQEWLLNFMAAEIDCVAVTDHNSGAWVDRLKDALTKLGSDQPQGYRELHLFPGMEISVHGGIHVLAIFDSSKNTADIDALRGCIEYRGTPGESRGVTQRSFVEVVDAVHSANGIAIPAHVDESNGLFNKNNGVTLEQMLDCKHIFAMEVVNPNRPKPQLFSDKHLQWTELRGSDSHHPIGTSGQSCPGSHFTWVKMGKPDIEGLRLALLDGGLSVRRSDQEAGNPNEHTSLMLESIEITHARYLGRSQPFRLQLNPWLNAVIGGRGTGKSTSVELLRIALRREDEWPPDELKHEFSKYSEVCLNRTDGGLLTNNAVIRVGYRKNGDRFRIQWKQAGDLEPIERLADGAWKPAQGEIGRRFPVRIYSQKQIFQLAKTPLALLKIVDDAPEVDHHALTERLRTEEARFLLLRARAREMEAGFAEEPRLRGELEDVRRKLTIFEQAGHAEVLKAFQKRSRQKRTVEAWEESWTDTGEKLRGTAREIVPDFLEEAGFDKNSPEDAELHRLAVKARENMENIRRQIEALASQSDSVAAWWRKERDDSMWSKSAASAESTYRKLQERLTEEEAGEPAAYGELVQHRQAVEQELTALSERKKQVEEIRAQAVTRLESLAQIRRDITAFRRSFLDTVLAENPYIRIQVVPYGAEDRVEEEFRGMIQASGSVFEKDIGSPDGEGLLGALYGQERDGTAAEKNLSAIKDKIKEIQSGHNTADAVRDRRFAAHIAKLPPEAVDRLDVWFPEDSLNIEYSPTGDGKGFRSIQEGSPGQKTAALLAFLLSYGEDPLILDQPEDDLDNHLIYDLIVTQLREVKRHRQIIVVTHNANIVVNGDAELVAALTVRGGETQKECEGSLQEKNVRDTICAVMEGGRKAFEDRYRRIALEETHV